MGTGWPDDIALVQDGSGRRVSFSDELGGERDGARDSRQRQNDREAGSANTRLHPRRMTPFPPRSRAAAPGLAPPSLAATPMPAGRFGAPAGESPASSLQSVGAMQGSLGSDGSGGLGAAAAADPDAYLTSIGGVGANPLTGDNPSGAAASLPPVAQGSVLAGGAEGETSPQTAADTATQPMPKQTAAVPAGSTGSGAHPPATVSGVPPTQAPLQRPLQSSISVPSEHIRAAAIEAEQERRRAPPGAGAARDGLPPRWHRRTQSIGGGAQPPSSAPTVSPFIFKPEAQPIRRRGRNPSAAEAAVEDELRGRLLRRQQLSSTSPQGVDAAVAGLGAAPFKAGVHPRQAALRATDPTAGAGALAGDGLAGLPDGMPRVAVHAAVRSHDRMHHSATSSMDGASIRSQSPRVVQHAVAGDLFLAETDLHRHSPFSSARNLARHSMTGGVKASPGARAGGRGSSSDKHAFGDAGGDDAESDILEEDDLKDDDEEGAAANKWWHRTWVRHMFVWVPILLSLCFLVAGIILVIFFRGRNTLYFDAWRWCFFICAFVPIYWLSRLVVHLLVLVVEAKLFTNAKVLFFLLSVRRDLGRMLRMVAWIPVSAALFGPVSNRAEGVKTVYETILRLLGCVALFWLGNILKTVIARSISSHFHKEAHFHKMKDALEQEAYLAALSQPRQEHRVDDLVLGLSRGEDTQNLGELAPGQLETLRAERAASRRPVALDVMSRAFRARRSSSSGTNGIELERASTCPAPTTSSGLRRTQPAIASVTEEGPQSPSRSTSNANLRRPATPQSAQVGRVPSSTAGAQPIGQPGTGAAEGGLLRHMSRRKDRPSTPSNYSGSAAVKGKGKGGKKLEKSEELAHKVSLPGGASSELDVVMKLHKVEKHIRKNKLKVTLSDEIGATGGKELSSKAQARRLAFYLFWNIKADFSRNYIVREDLEHFLPARKAAKAFALLDTDNDGKVTLHNTRDAVIQVYKERKDLAATLKDTRTVVGRLEFLIAFVVHTAFIFFYLLIFRVNVNRVWLTISSIVLAFAFVFGNSIRNVFESVVFLFVVHPFDVGDALLVVDPGDSSAGPQYYKVEEMMLLNTKVKRWDGACVYFPNSVLDTNPLINLSRSDNKWEFFKVWCDIGTPASAFDEINARLKEYLEDQSGEFTGQFSAMNIAGGDPMKIQLGVFFEYTFNGADVGRVNRARHGLYAMLCAALTELEVTFTMPSFSHQPRGHAGESSHQQMAAAGGTDTMLAASAATRPYSFY